MFYTENFRKALSYAENSNLYLGTGNPNSKILIVGKELGFDNPVQEMCEINENIEKWKKNVENSLTKETIDANEKCNPLFPYKGQLRIKNNNKNKGTSQTWLNYQKLHDKIYNTSTSEIVFHKDFFLTEINQIPSKLSKYQDFNKRRESIGQRIKFFRQNDYFQNFPINILTCKAYLSDPKEIFIKEFSDGIEILDIKFNPCIRYISKDKSKIVFLTRQLSNSLNMGVIENIKIEIHRFCKENEILL